MVDQMGCGVDPTLQFDLRQAHGFADQAPEETVEDWRQRSGVYLGPGTG
jgi:hypothetical protein